MDGNFYHRDLKANSNNWPSCWDDLHDEYQRLNDPQSYPFTWEKLQNRVVVDWKADPQKLLHAHASDSPPFIVVRLSDGSKHNWEGGEPNQMILSYLLASANPTQEPSNSHSVKNLEAASSTNE